MSRRILPNFPLDKCLAVVLLCCVGLLGCGGGDDGGSPRPTAIGLDQVIEEVRVIVDETRSTPPNREFAGSPERTLETRLWYAATGLRRPACRGDRCALIVLAHGFGGRTSRFDAIGQRLAAAGYIVAAVSFPRTNQDTPGGHETGIGDTREQPADISAVVDALLEADTDPADSLFGRIDAGSIGAMGHSLGGAAVIGLTRMDCCLDSRIGATAYVEPLTVAVEQLFAGPYHASGPPTLTFQGEVAFPIPPEDTREFHAALAPPKLLVEMVGGNHVNMIERFAEQPDPLLEQAAETMIDFFDWYLRGGGRGLDPVIAALTASGHTISYSGG